MARKSGKQQASELKPKRRPREDADTVALEKRIADALGLRMTPSEAMRRVVSAGRLGRKGRSGFYKYDASGKKGDVDSSVYQVIGATARANAGQHVAIPAEEMVRRCVLAMVNEAARCLQEGILRNVRDGDVGAVFGIGFPPFRGGPFRYVDTVGVASIVRQLQELNTRHPPRFEAAELLVEMATAGKTFLSRKDMIWTPSNYKVRTFAIGSL